jgi:CBS domain-containing protein
MQSMKVAELMIPLAEYTTVSEDATLGDAVLALEDAHKRTDGSREKHRAVLVLNKTGQVVGKLDQWTVLWAIEPRYKIMGNLKETSRFGFSRGFLTSMLQSYGLWRKPLEDLCKKAADISIAEIVHAPLEDEFISHEATLDEAIHQMVMCRHASLLVKRGEAIIGILRQSDIFKEVCDRIKVCKI